MNYRSLSLNRDINNYAGESENLIRLKDFLAPKSQTEEVQGEWITTLDQPLCIIDKSESEESLTAVRPIVEPSPIVSLSPRSACRVGLTTSREGSLTPMDKD